VALRKALANVLQLQVGSSYLVWYSLVGPYIPVLITGIIPELTCSTSVEQLLKNRNRSLVVIRGSFKKIKEPVLIYNYGFQILKKTE
jgi:hypothetical protein